MINEESVVCNCNFVTLADLQAMHSEYPDMPVETLRLVCNIGSRCGCCNHKDCPSIDLHFSEAIKILKEF